MVKRLTGVFVLWLAGLASWSSAQYPVGTIYTNDYTDAYGHYRWISLQTESGSVQHGLQTQWRLSGSLYWTLEMSYGQRHGVADRIAVVRGCRIKPVENGPYSRAMTVESPHCGRNVSRFVPAPS